MSLSSARPLQGRLFPRSGFPRSQHPRFVSIRAQRRIYGFRARLSGPQISRRSKLWLLAGSLILGGCLCWVAITENEKPNFSYEGKPLSYWFNQLPMTCSQGAPGSEIAVQCARKRAYHIKSGAVQQYGAWGQEPEVSAKAIRKIGTNGLKFYFSKLEGREVPLQSKIQKAAFQIGLRCFLFADVNAEREQATTALILLKPLPQDQVRELLALSTNRNARISGAARCVLATELGNLLTTRTSDEAIRSKLEDKRFWR
jgi:hypothetical protein